jgi:hypothetical protein
LRLLRLLVASSSFLVRNPGPRVRTLLAKGESLTPSGSPLGRGRVLVRERRPYGTDGPTRASAPLVFHPRDLRHLRAERSCQFSALSGQPDRGEPASSRSQVRRTWAPRPRSGQASRPEPPPTPPCEGGECELLTAAFSCHSRLRRAAAWQACFSWSRTILVRVIKIPSASTRSG